MSILNYQRLNYLSQKLNNNQATKAEVDEYMYLMFEYGKITAKQYADYKANKDKEDLVNGALAIGGVVLLGYLLSKLLEK